MAEALSFGSIVERETESLTEEEQAEVAALLREQAPVRASPLPQKKKKEGGKPSDTQEMIAMAVAGVAVLGGLALAFWWFTRDSKKPKRKATAAASKDDAIAAASRILSEQHV